MLAPFHLKTISTFICLFCVACASGCATVRISKPDVWNPAVTPAETWVGGGNSHTTSSPATTMRKRTIWILFWGWNQENIRPADCMGNGFAEVRVSTNLAFAFISVVSLGFVQPITIQWKCAKPEQSNVKDF